MTSGAPAGDPLGAGWAALRAFFHDGTAALHAALDRFRAAEPAIRGSGDPTPLTLWLLGIATALQYTRIPEPMEAALQRARELVNVVARTQDEPATIPYRTLVEAISRDLADVIPAQAVEYLADALDYSDRTLRLARKTKRDEWLAAGMASRGDLLVRQAGNDRRVIRRALTLYEDARRRWPARDADGRARLTLRYAAALLAAGKAGAAETAAREALASCAARGDRYHVAEAHLTLARALFAQDQDEALDEQAAAVSLYKELGCRWERARAEGALT